MGFRLPESTVVVEFAESSPYHGAEVVLSLDLTMDDALTMDSLRGGDNPAAVFDEIGRVLKRWNLEDAAGAPVPCDATQLRRQPLPFVLELFRGYQRAVERLVTVDAPFAGQSNNGST